jgi:uncharacterized protein YjiS (DUF1127 family)
MQILHICGAACRLLHCTIDPYFLFDMRFRLGAGQERKTKMLVAIINFLQAWRRYNTSLRELYQLGDRELADIGISRSDIPRVAWDAANNR